MKKKHNKTHTFVMMFFFAFTFFHCFNNTYGQTNISGGNVSGNWTKPNSPYKISGNITVPQDSVLRIDPGVKIEFQGHYQILNNGRIIALGTLLDTIQFTAVSNWWGIRFDGIQGSQDSSVFHYCKIDKGNANGSGNYSNGGAFFISNFSKIRVSNSLIKNNYAYINGGAFYCSGSAPLIANNNIYNNNAASYYGGGIFCTNSSPIIKRNNITDNVGNICCKSSSSPLIFGNTINNSQLNCGIYCEYSSP